MDDWLEEQGIPALEEVDTRKLTRHIRAEGAMRGVVAVGPKPDDEVRDVLERSPSMQGLDLASRATRETETVVEPKARAKYRIVDSGDASSNLARGANEPVCK